jgi:circadian clock protein KaiB
MVTIVKKREALHILPPYLLKLYVTTYGISSHRAVRNITALLQENFPDTYRLEIIDIKQHPLIALKENITATPMLLRAAPEPQRRMVGDMSDSARVLASLQITTN